MTGHLAKGYRDAYSTTKQFWYNCEEAAKVALVNVGTTVPCGKVRFKYSTKINALVCKLPSGRLIHWPRAEIDPNAQHHGVPRQTRSYTWVLGLTTSAAHGDIWR